MIFNDIIKEMEEFLKKKSLPDFIYVRIPKGFSNTDYANDFLKKADQTYPWGWDNYTGDFSKILLSVNLSLFGNMYNSSSCTFAYFANNSGCWSQPLDNHLSSLLDSYAVSKKYINSFCALLSDIDNSEGNLLQIFIPKKSVDLHAYLCIPGGVPYMSSLVPGCFDHNIGRHTAISPILDLYIKKPKTISDLDQLQARIVVTQQGMLNPDSGIKILRYDTLADNERKAYSTKMKTTAGKILLVWINQSKVSGTVKPNPVTTFTNP